ncbi:MAG TPA: MaoC family dehydratase [Longimicrobiales bacterium]|nr:MaoC family dehydratase [Longimicrobiales bacterium]
MALVVVPGLDALRQHLGTEVAVSDWLEVSQERIDRFAEITEDRQWIHTDAERARRESPYRTTIAHGFLTLSFLSRFLTSAVEVEGTRLLVSCGLTSVRFLQPVPAGARIRARVRLRECTEETGFVQATWRLTIECEGQRLAACIADWVVRYHS